MRYIIHWICFEEFGSTEIYAESMEEAIDKLLFISPYGTVVIWVE